MSRRIEYTPSPPLTKWFERSQVIEEKAAEFWKDFSWWFVKLTDKDQDLVVEIMKLIAHNSKESQ